MRESIAVLGTLDTKGDQIKYLKELIEKRGYEACVVDVGVVGPVPFVPTITREEVARAAGTTIEDIIALNAPGSAMVEMAKGCLGNREEPLRSQTSFAASLQSADPGERPSPCRLSRLSLSGCRSSLLPRWHTRPRLRRTW